MPDGTCNIPLLVPDIPTLDEISPYLRRIDESRWYTNFGPLCVEFETRLKQFLGPPESPPALTTIANCTLGLELTLSALGLPPGARVLVPALTFLATASAVIRAGYTPVFADVDPETWMLTPEIARDALSFGSIEAVLPVAAFGCAQPVEPWDALAVEHGIPVVIDAAGAFGNQAVGEHTVVVYSLHATKSLGVGEGGLVAARNPELIERIREATYFGIDFSLGVAVRVGTNAKMSEYHCAVGLAALDRWTRIHKRRVELRDRYRTNLSNTPVRFQKGLENAVISILPIHLPAPISAHEVSQLFSQSGIETRAWYLPPITHHPIFQGFSTAGSLSTTLALSDSLLGMPFHTRLTTRDIDFVCERLESTIQI